MEDKGWLDTVMLSQVKLKVSLSTWADGRIDYVPRQNNQVACQIFGGEEF